MKHTGPTPEQRLAVMERATYRCERCGDNPAMSMGGPHIHHRQPRKMGGTSRPDINDPSNLLLLDAKCHEWIESNRTLAYEQGWLVREPTDPATVPVTTPWGRVLLRGDRYEEMA